MNNKDNDKRDSKQSSSRGGKTTGNQNSENSKTNRLSGGMEGVASQPLANNRYKRNSNNNPFRFGQNNLNSINTGNNNKNNNGNNIKRNNPFRFGQNSLNSVNNDNNTVGNNEDNKSNNTSDNNVPNDDSNANIGNVDNDLNNISKKVTRRIIKRILRIISFLAIKLFIGFIATLFFIIVTICTLLLPLIILGIIDTGDVANFVLDPIVSGISNSIDKSSSSSVSMTSTSDGEAVFPIGSDEVTTVNGVDYALGEPSTTKITATFDGNDDVHNGSHGAIDISAEVNGANVIATLPGVVLYPTKNDRIDYPNGYYCSRDGEGYGNYVMIEHDNGLVSIYAHMYANTITVRAGDRVKKGQVIGRTGTSGCSTGGHLHFEMRVNKKKVNPFEYVSVDNPRNVNDNLINKERLE